MNRKNLISKIGGSMMATSALVALSGCGYNHRTTYQHFDNKDPSQHEIFTIGERTKVFVGLAPSSSEYRNGTNFNR